MCGSIWQTSNLPPLRIIEEKGEEEEDTTAAKHNGLPYWAAVKKLKLNKQEVQTMLVGSQSKLLPSPSYGDSLWIDELVKQVRRVAYIRICFASSSVLWIPVLRVILRCCCALYIASNLRQ